MYFFEGSSQVYWYGIHLTPGLTEVRSYAAFFTSLPAEGLRVRFRGIPALKASQGVRPAMPRPRPVRLRPRHPRWRRRRIQRRLQIRVVQLVPQRPGHSHFLCPSDVATDRAVGDLHNGRDLRWRRPRPHSSRKTSRSLHMSGAPSSSSLKDLARGRKHGPPHQVIQHPSPPARALRPDIPRRPERRIQVDELRRNQWTK